MDFFFSALLTSLVSAGASVFATIYGVRLRQTRQRDKQERFSEKLETDIALGKFRDREPEGKKEIDIRRDIVKAKVKVFSIEVFDREFPEADSSPQPDPTYPPINCKWCWKDVSPESGPLGMCPHCRLPFCYWIGCNKNSEPPADQPVASVAD